MSVWSQDKLCVRKGIQRPNDGKSVMQPMVYIAMETHNGSRQNDSSSRFWKVNIKKLGSPIQLKMNFIYFPKHRKELKGREDSEGKRMKERYYKYCLVRKGWVETTFINIMESREDEGQSWLACHCWQRPFGLLARPPPPPSVVWTCPCRPLWSKGELIRDKSPSSSPAQINEEYTNSPCFYPMCADVY